ncbi:DUF2752 domain-containing protein [Salegentibacter sp. F14]
MLPCLNKSLLGMECFGCGGQRAAFLVIQGNFTEAFYMYPAIYPILLLLAFLVLNLFFKFKGDYQVKIGLIIFAGIIMAVNYGYKMYEFIQLTN